MMSGCQLLFLNYLLAGMTSQSSLLLMNNPSDNIILELMVKTEESPIAEKK